MVGSNFISNCYECSPYGSRKTRTTDPQPRSCNSLGERVIYGHTRARVCVDRNIRNRTFVVCIDYAAAIVNHQTGLIRGPTFIRTDAPAAPAPATLRTVNPSGRRQRRTTDSDDVR